MVGCLSIESAVSGQLAVASVVLQNVHKIYPDGIRAVGPLNLEIAEGEILAILGPSGCGKTTTLRLIAGLESVSSGTIHLGPTDVTRLSPRRRKVAMVFQEYALYPHLSVFDNLAFALRLAKIDRARIEHKVREAAAVLGLEHLLRRRPDELSGGERQRVALGRAIVRDVQCLLLDEPLSSVDPSLRRELRLAIATSHERLRTTTIYVTHDQQEAMALGQKIAVMRRGRIHQVGPPLEIYRRPADLFVARFVGTLPMNCFAGRLVSEAGHLWFQDEVSRLRIPPEVAEQLRDRDGLDVVLGVRPETLRAAREEDHPPMSLAGKVTRLEPLGEEIDVTLTGSNGATVLARLRTDDLLRVRRGLSAGDRLRLAIDERRLYFFKPGTDGRNLLL